MGRGRVPRYCARKTMRLFRANVDSVGGGGGDSGGLSIRTRCGGTSPLCTVVNLFPIHYGGSFVCTLETR